MNMRHPDQPTPPPESENDDSLKRSNSVAALATAMEEEFARDRDRDPREWDAVLLDFRIDRMRNGLGEGQMHYQFAELIEEVLDLFPKGEVSDADLRSNPATPLLLRYLLGALRNYDSRVRGIRSADRRAFILAEAMLARGDRGPNARKWTTELQIKYVAAAAAAYHAQLARSSLAKVPDEAHAMAENAALKAAYKQYQGTAAKQNARDRTATTTKLKALLRIHGYWRRSPSGQ